MTVDKLKKYVKESYISDTILVLAVIDKETDKHIGNISLQSIDWINKSAEIAFLLGEKKYWGKNIMFEAGSLLIDHGFKMLNLHRIYCGTSSENIGMQKLANKLGMIKEGQRKDALFKNGKYLDVIEYGIIVKES
jgi:RimJ/RimL family protein N-acetyltransferase